MQLQLTGTLAGIEARNGGWFGISFMEPGAQYPKKLSTKKAELVQQCQQMMGQVVTASYNESESTNINPNNNQPYINRFLEAISMPGQPLPQAQQQSYQPQPQQQFVPQPQPQAQNFQAPQQHPQNPVPGGYTPPPQQIPLPQPIIDLREKKIHRQAAAKVSVQLLQYLDPADQNLASLVRISEQLVQYFDNGVQWTTPPVQPTHTPPQGWEQAERDAAPQPQPPRGHDGAPVQEQYYGQPDPDDGIPF